MIIGRERAESLHQGTGFDQGAGVWHGHSGSGGDEERTVQST
jgi:hypothetical protein